MAYTPMYINPATSNFVNDWQNAAQVSQMMQQNAYTQNPQWGYWNAVVGNAFGFKSEMPEGYLRKDYEAERAIAARQLTWSPIIAGGGVVANAALTAAMYGNMGGFLSEAMPGTFRAGRLPFVGQYVRPTLFGAINPAVVATSAGLTALNVAERIGGLGSSFVGRWGGRAVGAATGGLVGGAAKATAWSGRLFAASMGFSMDNTRWMTNWGVAGTLSRWGGTLGGVAGGFAASFLNPAFLAKNYLLERGIEYAQDAYDSLMTEADLQREMLAKGSRILRYGFSDQSRGLRGGFTGAQRTRFSQFIDRLAKTDERVARMDAFHMGSSSVFGGHHRYVENLKELKALFSTATDMGMLDLSKSLDDVEKRFSELVKVVKKLNRITGKSKGELAAAMASIQQSEARFNLQEVGRALERRSYAAMATGASLGTAMMEGQMGAQLGAQFGVGKALGADMATQSRLVINRMLRAGAIDRKNLAAMGGEEGAITALTSGLLGSMNDDTFMFEMALDYDPSTGGFTGKRLNQYIGADTAKLQALHRERYLALRTKSLNPLTGRFEYGGAIKGLMPQVQYALQTGELKSGTALKWIANLTRQTIATRGQAFGRTSVINTLTEKFGYATAMQLAPVILNGEYLDAPASEQAEVARFNALQRYDRETTGRGMTAGAIGMFGGLAGIVSGSNWTDIAGLGLLGSTALTALGTAYPVSGLVNSVSTWGLQGLYRAGWKGTARFLQHPINWLSRHGMMWTTNAGLKNVGSLVGDAIQVLPKAGGLGLGLAGVTAVGLGTIAAGFGLYHGWGLLNAAMGDSGWRNYYRNRYNRGKADIWRQLYGLSDFGYDMMSHGGEEAINMIYGDPEARVANFGVDTNRLSGAIVDRYSRASIAVDRALSNSTWRGDLPEPDDAFLSKTSPERYFASVARSMGRSWNDNSVSYKAGQLFTSSLFTTTGSQIGSMMGSALGPVGSFVGGLLGNTLSQLPDIYRYHTNYLKDNPNAAGSIEGFLANVVNNPYFSNGSMLRSTLYPWKLSFGLAGEAYRAIKPGLNTITDIGKLLWGSHFYVGAGRNLVTKAIYDQQVRWWPELLKKYNTNRLAAAGNYITGELIHPTINTIRNSVTDYAGWIGNKWDATSRFIDKVGSIWNEEGMTLGEFMRRGGNWTGRQFDRYITEPLVKWDAQIPNTLPKAAKVGAKTFREWLFKEYYSNGAVGARLGKFASSWRGVGVGLALDAASLGLEALGDYWEDSDSSFWRNVGWASNVIGRSAGTVSYGLTGTSIGFALSGGNPLGALVGAGVGTLLGGYAEFFARPSRSLHPSERWKREMRVGVLAGYSDVQRTSLSDMYGQATAAKLMKNHKLGEVTRDDIRQATDFLMREQGLTREVAAEKVKRNLQYYNSDSYNDKLNSNSEFITGEWTSSKALSPIQSSIAQSGGAAAAAYLAAPTLGKIGGALGSFLGPVGTVIGYGIGYIGGTVGGAWLGGKLFGGGDTGRILDATRSLMMNGTGGKDLGLLVRMLSGEMTRADVERLNRATTSAAGTKERAILDSLTSLLTQAGAGEFNEDRIEDAIIKVAKGVRWTGGDKPGAYNRNTVAKLLNNVDKSGMDAVRKVASMAKDWIEKYNADLVISGINTLNLSTEDASQLKDFLREKSSEITSDTLKKKLTALGIKDLSGGLEKVKPSVLMALAVEGQKSDNKQYKNELDAKLDEYETDPQKTIAKTQVEIAKYLKEANLLMNSIATKLGGASPNMSRGGRF